MANVQIFLSTVSAEFGSYRDAVRRDVERPNVAVKVQEDFIATGTETLDKLDEYIRHCDAVIHLVGDMTGSRAKPRAVAAIVGRYSDFSERLPLLGPFLEPGGSALSYTEWEAWLALYHGKKLIIAVPRDGAPRDERYELDHEQRAAQREHLERLRTVGRYPEIHFANADRLVVELWRSSLLDVLALAGAGKKNTRNLRYLSIGDLFKGRDTMLSGLTESFGWVSESSSTPVVARVLNGMGGVGKTRLAVEYAWRRVSDYAAILWVDAGSPEAVQRNLAALCARVILDLPEQRETDERKKCEAVLAWLRQHPGWLLIMDSIDSEPAAAATEALLPQLAGGHVLLTSRLTDWSGNVAALPVGELSPDSAIDFLLARTEGRRRPQADDPAAARTVAEELGYLALALEHGGAYIVQRRLSFAGYLEEWRGQRDKVLRWFNPRLMKYPKSVAITWQTSIDQLSEAARRLLQRLAWLAPEPIPEFLLEVPAPELDAAESDPLNALATLESYSLVTRAAHTASFSVHRLVQEVSRRAQRNDGTHAALEEGLQWVNAAFVGDPQDVRDWPVLDPLMPHSQAVAEHADVAGIPEPTAKLLNEVGLLLLAKSLYAKAEPHLERALAIREKALGREHPNVAMSLNSLAGLYESQGAYAKAQLFYERALAILENAPASEHVNLAVCLNNLAVLFHKQGAYAKSESTFECVLVILEKELGPEHPHVARSLNNLASLYIEQGAYAKAEPIFERALGILEKALGPEHHHVATGIDNLASLYDKQGTYAKAEPLHERALALREKALGPEHRDVATSLNNFGEHYRKQSVYAKAEPLLDRALAIREKVLGSQHHDVAATVNNLALIYEEQGAYAKAEVFFKRALAILEKALAPEHPDLAWSLNNLAFLYDKQGAYAKAEPLFERALAIREKALRPEQPGLATRLYNLAEHYRRQGACAKAEPLMRRALTLRVKSLGTDHASSRAVAANYVALLQAMGRTQDEINSELSSLGGWAGWINPRAK